MNQQSDLFAMRTELVIILQESKTEQHFVQSSLNHYHECFLQLSNIFVDRTPTLLAAEARSIITSSGYFHGNKSNIQTYAKKPPGLNGVNQGSVRVLCQLFQFYG